VTKMVLDEVDRNRRWAHHCTLRQDDAVRRTAAVGAQMFGGIACIESLPCGFWAKKRGRDRQQPEARRPHGCCR
jgi:hypothetical protein